MKKNIVVVILMIAVIGGAWFFLGEKKNEVEAPEVRVARPVKTFVVESEVSGSSRIFPGAVAASQRVDIAFRVSGQLMELPIVRGQAIEKDAMLAKLDPRDFESHVKNARAALDGAKAQLASMRTGRKEDVAALEAAVSSAQARLTEASTQFQRITNLFEKQAVSKSQHDQAKATYDVAAANLTTAKQNLEKGRAGARPEDIAAQEAAIKGLEAQLKKSEDALMDTQLTAPFSGVIAELYVDNFQSVNADQKIAVLHNLSKMEITINLPGNLLLEIQAKGLENEGISGAETDALAEATFSSLPGRKFPLKFKEIATAADTQTQTYAATFMLEISENIFVFPGMVADVRLTLASNVSGGGFALPLDAVVAGEGTSQYVWKIIEDAQASSGLIVKKVPVTVASYQSNAVIISGGVERGDKIVAAGIAYLLENDPVTIFEARP